MDGPQFLVIGGMKCGSTSLYDDLRAQPSVFLAEKELDLLSDPHFSIGAARSTYRKAFARSSSGQIRGDVSTTYAKLPDYPHVAERAAQLLGSQLKIVYVAREPVARCVSHHYHMHSWQGSGHMPASIDECLRKFPSLISYSRYALQLEPWRRRFGDESIHIVLFEEFIANRAQTMLELSSFLGFAADVALTDAEAISNRSAGKPVLSKFWLRIHQTPVYHATLRRLIPSSLRSELRRLLLPKAPPRPAALSPDSVEFVLDQTKRDELELRKFMGRDQPLWDVDAVRRRYSQPSVSAA